ncbi:MAG TPA: DUF167 domain-containing protein [Pseudonocardia sp.]|nr:DUF167 domain-containing protein [Pseudonocardia sp.]
MKVSVRVRPGARADIVGGHWDGPRGPALLVAVRARAVEGFANAAVLAALAEAFGVRRGDVALVSGARGRNKVVAVEGDEAVLAARHTALLG